MRKIRITQEIKPGVYKGKIDDVALDRFVVERLAYAASRGTEVIWDVSKPAEFEELVLASGSNTALPIVR